MANAISLTAVSKSYGSYQALRELSLEVESASICGLLGPNGAGKTTTLKLILGLLRADSGQVTVMGLDCWKESLELKRQIGFLSADQTFPGWLTARKVIQLTSELRRTELTKSALELADRLRLALDQPISRMSRGNVQKVGLILALSVAPKLLILDEPTSGLDPLVQESFFELLREARQAGTTVLLSSHTFSEVDRLCDQIVVIKSGVAVVSEALREFRQRAVRRVRLEFKSEVMETPPDGFEVTLQDGAILEGHWSGPAPALLSWCSERALVDIEISPPQLDDAFLGFYR